MKKTVLITGANGLLGQKLSTMLSKNPAYHVVASGRGCNRLQTNDNYNKDNYKYVTLDIIHEAEIFSVFDRYKPDAVIHCAAMTQADQCETDPVHCQQVNVAATKSIVKACEKHQSFLCFLSTDFIFDGKDGPYTETSPTHPINTYGQSKLQAEHIIQHSAIDWAIVRTVLVYGLTDEKSRSNFILWVKKSLEQQSSLNITNDQWRTPTLVEDLALGCIKIVHKKAQGIFNIAGEDLLTPYDMAMIIANYFELDTNLITETTSKNFTQKAKRPLKTGLIIEKAKKELGYKPHRFIEGIAILEQQVNKTCSSS